MPAVCCATMEYYVLHKLARGLRPSLTPLKRIHKMPTFNIRLTPSQAERLALESNELGITRGSLIKERVFGHTIVRKKPRSDQIEIRRLVGQIGKIGNNLNQIAKQVNSSNDFNELRNLNRIQIDLMSIRKEALKTLGINE